VAFDAGTVQILTAKMARSQDPDGFADLVPVCRTDPANSHTKNVALRRIATMMAVKGGEVRDITAGDCAFLPHRGAVQARGHQRGHHLRHPRRPRPAGQASRPPKA
jgi:hypothetical protein